jgi:hypothetical protein
MMTPIRPVEKRKILNFIRKLKELVKNAQGGLVASQQKSRPESI